MRKFLALVFLTAGSLSGVAQATSSRHIGVEAGREMAGRLWSAKYHRNCFDSDRFLSELDRMQGSLSRSPYHQGYRQGMDQVSDRVANDCHSSKIGMGGTPKGECPETGFQHGNNLGMQVCSGIRSSPRVANTCAQQAMSTCFDGLQKYVQENCRGQLRSPSYRQAERECQQTFSMR